MKGSHVKINYLPERGNGVVVDTPLRYPACAPSARRWVPYGQSPSNDTAACPVKIACHFLWWGSNKIRH